MKAVRGSGSRAIGGPLVPRVPSAARTVENRIPEDDRDDTRSTGGIHGTIDDRRRSTRQEIFIQKGYFIARGVLLSLGFGTRFPTRVFSPFHACLVPLNKLLVFFFFRLLCRAVSFPPRLCFFHAHSFPLSKPASRPALTATGISKRRTMTTATKKTVMCDLT